MPPDGELAREEGILGHEADEEREPGETRVGGQNQDQRGGRLQCVVEDLAGGGCAVDQCADLGDDGRCPRHERHAVGERGQDRHAEEHHPEDRAHEHEGGAGIACLGLPEDADPVGDGFGARHGRAAVGEGPQQEEGRHAEDQSPARVPERDRVGVRGLVWEITRYLADESEHNQQGHVEDEEVGRDGEYAARLPDAAQVAVGQDHHEGDAHCHRHPRLLAQGRCGRDDRVGTRGHRHCDGDGVADQQCGSGDLRDVGAEVVAADHVGTTGLGVRAHDVPVTNGHHREHAEDRRGHGCHDGEGRQPGDGHQNAQHLLGGVSGRRHHVRRQDGERSRLAQSLAVEVLADQGRSQQHAFDPVATALGQVGGDRGVGPRGGTRQVVDGLLAVGPLRGRHAGHGYGLVLVRAPGELRRVRPPRSARR